MVRTNQSEQGSGNAAGIASKLIASKRKGKTIAKTIGKEKRKRRYRPGMLALKEIRYYQESAKLLLAKRPFFRLVKEITDGLKAEGSHNYWQASALEALQVCESLDLFLGTYSSVCSFEKFRF